MNLINPERIIPGGRRNPYAHHPGFRSQTCPCSHTVTPSNINSCTTSHGFACLVSGGHCVPDEGCTQRVELWKRKLISMMKERTDEKFYT